MSFTVSPEALDSYAGLVAGQEQHTDAMTRYHDAEIAPEMDWGGVLSLLGEVYPRMTDDLYDSVAKINKLFQFSSKGSQESAEQYREMDQSQAEQLDRVIPGMPPSWMPEIEKSSAPRFHEIADPTAALVAPGNYESQFSGRWTSSTLSG